MRQSNSSMMKSVAGVREMQRSTIHLTLNGAKTRNWKKWSGRENTVMEVRGGGIVV